MKYVKTLLKLAAVAAAIAGIAYLVVKNIDTITAWLGKFCPTCKYKAEAAAMNEDDFAVPPVVETVAEAEAAEEIPAEEEAPAADGEPVAEESDFEA